MWQGDDVKTIRALRQERGWTQFELALKVGVQPQAVYFWESGRRTPQVPQLRRLGQIFGMCSDEIDLTASHHGADEADGYRGGRARAGDSADYREGRLTAGDGSQASVAED
jgi:transcriptional regulator with XRE-family HTH domain